MRDLRLDGDLSTDDTVLDAAADDFGHLVRHRPRAVLRPASTADIATVLVAAGEAHVPVVARGRGHSGFGQAQAADGIVIDMGHLNEIHSVSADRVVVDAGATWCSVLTATLAHGLTPPVLTDHLGVSVGGTLAVGGIGGASHRHGVQTDTVLELDVITGDGASHTCAPDREPDLFHAVLAGHGQCGITTRATIRLVPAPALTRRHKLHYPTAAALAADQRRLLHENRFAHLQGQVLPGDNGCVHLLEAAHHHDPSETPDDAAALADLSFDPATAEVEELSYEDFADRLAPAEAYLRGTGEWAHPHPWWNAFLPDSTVDEFVARLLSGLTPAGLGAPGLVLTYPIHTAALRTPLFRVPAEPVVFLVSVLRFTPPDQPTELAAQLAENARWYDLARAAGGTTYPIHTVPNDPDHWPNHFGPAWPALVVARRKYDPRSILTPGPDMFRT